MLGFNTIDVSASAKACSPCNSVPLDIQLVVDRTGSMSANGGSTNGQNKWENLQDGLLNGFLPGLDSGLDYVGLTHAAARRPRHQRRLQGGQQQQLRQHHPDVHRGAAVELLHG